jgi:hypothetical protein
VSYLEILVSAWPGSREGEWKRERGKEEREGEGRDSLVGQWLTRPTVDENLEIAHIWAEKKEGKEKRRERIPGQPLTRTSR